ncbi:geranylfarnesyl diphosphate synthase [Halobacterium salinarum]|uniref:geranylfarnesyl diphosphate synthase n=1 Tax=Halobacterium salinarum TaxID=2242 RepID=UPI0025574DB8|nr:polyprenyl synthetase family protein [Halobacterium salinarum]MDL0128033.1 polyprenyl synthetase family protein [Halobacterium salinarum]
MSQEARERAVLAAVRERRQQVNDAIDDDLPVAEPERLYEASRYILEAGGKRLRPAVLLLTAEALADTSDTPAYRDFPDCIGGHVDVMSAAVSIEVIQSFTLIHDDIMDDDDLRRGSPAVHREYDTETAILAGDTLYSKAFEIMLETGAPPERGLRAMRTLAETCTHICEGQAMDIDFETRGDVVTDEYLEMVELKTAVLYAAAATLPGLLLSADEETVEALYNYGLRVGQAFQIQDDVLDLTVPSAELGKQRGSDLVEDKTTIITLHAAEHGVDVDGLLDAEDPADVTEAAVQAAVQALQDAGSIQYASGLAEDLVEEGKAHLEVLPENEARHRLEQIADYLIERGY